MKLRSLLDLGVTCPFYDGGRCGDVGIRPSPAGSRDAVARIVLSVGSGESDLPLPAVGSVTRVGPASRASDIEALYRVIDLAAGKMPKGPSAQPTVSSWKGQG